MERWPARKSLRIALIAGTIIAMLPLSPPSPRQAPEPLSWAGLQAALGQVASLLMAPPLVSTTEIRLPALQSVAAQSLPVEAAPTGTQHNAPLLFGGVSGGGVHTFTGNFATSRTDLAIGGRGPSPAFVRAYNSNDSRVTSMGPSWTHNYLVRLRSPSAGSNDVILVGASGRSDTYTLSGGNYTPPAAVTTALVHNGDGTWTATRPDQRTLTFASNGDLSTIKDRYGNTSSLTYNGSGQLTAVSDPAGRGSLSFSYHATTGRLLSVTDWMIPTARVVSFGYDGSNRLSTVTDRESKLTTYAYDGTSSRLTTITDPLNNVNITNTYDGSGRVGTQKDAKGLLSGQSTSYSYPSPGPSGTTVVTYPTTSFETSWTAKVEDTHDGNGRLTGRTSKPVSGSGDWITQSIGYDSNSFMNSFTDGLGQQTLYCFDVGYNGSAISGSRGNLTRVVQPAPTGGAARPVSLMQYDNKNNLTQSFPPKGVTSSGSTNCSTDLSSSTAAIFATAYEYDTGQTKLLKITRQFTDPTLGAQTAITKLEYNDGSNPGRVTRLIPPRGNTTGTPDNTYAANLVYFTTGSKAGLLDNATDALGNKVSYDYDTIGRRIKMVDANGNAAGGVPADHTWQYTYDRENRVLTTSAPAPTAGGSALVSSMTYDAAGNLTVAIDANGQVTKFLYDERNLLKESQQSPSIWTNPSTTPSPLIKTTFAYGHLGERTRVLRAQGDSTYERAMDYAADGLGRVRSMTEYPSWPATSGPLTSSSTYTLQGNRAVLTDPLSQITTFGYDNLGRLTGRTYTNKASATSTTANVTYTYDLQGNRLTMVDGGGTTSYTYDERNRLTAVTSPGSSTVGYRYDLDGNRTKLIYPNGNTVTYTFNKGSQLASLADWASPTPRTTSYTYTPAGSVQRVTNSNAATADYSYDNARRLIDVLQQHSGAQVSRHSYTLDAVGNRTQVTELLPDLSVGSMDPLESPDPWRDTLAVQPDILRAAGLGPAPSDGSEREPFAPSQPDESGLPNLVRAAAVRSAGGDPPAGPRSERTAGEAREVRSLLVELPPRDVANDGNEAYRYRADPRDHRVEFFEKANAAANVRLTHTQSGATIGVEWPGTSASRTLQGSEASAQLDGMSVRWTSYVDRLKEELVLARPVPSNEFPFTVRLTGLTLRSDTRGGYLAQDASGKTIFAIPAPTVTDANGQEGSATLTMEATGGRIRLDPAFAATATYPIRIDPTTIYSSATSTATAYNNSPRLLRDRYGKLLLIGTVNYGTVYFTASFSNNGGASWSSVDYTESGDNPVAPTWELDPVDDNVLHMVCQCNGAIQYRQWTITRDANKNITVINYPLPSTVVTLDTSGVRPSLVIDKNGFPAVAWTTPTTASSWEVRFLRAIAEPSYASSWWNAPGTSQSPDTRGWVSGTGIDGSVSLARMPAGTGANADALYLVWVNSSDRLVWSSRARVDGATYTVWGAAGGENLLSDNYLSAGTDWVSAVATASDSANGGVIIGYRESGYLKIIRKNRDNSADVNYGFTNYTAPQFSIGVNQGDLYVFWADSYGLYYREYVRGQWSIPTVVGSSGPASHPSARREVADGQIDVVFIRSNYSVPQVKYHRFAGARPAANYTYDRLYRLTSAPDGALPTTYTYDPVGNRLNRTRGSTSTNYTYDRADRILTAGSISYTVNANGNVTERGAPSYATFVYDQTNLLTSATVSGTTSTYAYDGDGKRRSKTVGGVTTNYVYDVNRELPVVLDDGIRKYVWGLGLANAIDTSGVPQSYFTDGLGSIRGLTDGNGITSQTYQTDEFGAPILTQGTNTQPFGFGGEQVDETGFHYLRARMYDPAVGRFLQRDPLGGGYVYAGNNPIGNIDPSGNACVGIGGACPAEPASGAGYVPCSLCVNIGGDPNVPSGYTNSSTPSSSASSPYQISGAPSASSSGGGGGTVAPLAGCVSIPGFFTCPGGDPTPVASGSISASLGGGVVQAAHLIDCQPIGLALWWDVPQSTTHFSVGAKCDAPVQTITVSIQLFRELSVGLFGNSASGWLPLIFQGCHGFEVGVSEYSLPCDRLLTSGHYHAQSEFHVTFPANHNPQAMWQSAGFRDFTIP